jgi:hypothetical protein
MLYLLAKAERNSLDERRGRGPIPASNISLPGMPLRRLHGRGSHPQLNAPVAYGVLAQPDAQRPTLALGSPGFEKRHIFW